MICTVEQKCEHRNSFHFDYSNICSQCRRFYVRGALASKFTAQQNAWPTSSDFQAFPKSVSRFYSTPYQYRSINRSLVNLKFHFIISWKSPILVQFCLLVQVSFLWQDFVPKTIKSLDQRRFKWAYYNTCPPHETIHCTIVGLCARGSVAEKSRVLWCYLWSKTARGA